MSPRRNVVAMPGSFGAPAFSCSHTSLYHQDHGGCVASVRDSEGHAIIVLWGPETVRASYPSRYALKY